MKETMPHELARLVVSYVNTGNNKCRNTAIFARTCKFFKAIAGDQLSKNEKQYNAIQYLIKNLQKEKHNTKDIRQVEIIDEILTGLNSLSPYKEEELRQHRSALILYLSFNKPHHQLGDSIKALVDEVIEDNVENAIQDINWLTGFLWKKREEFIGSVTNETATGPWIKIFESLLSNFLYPDPDPLDEKILFR